jgi:galactoside 2-L-fucosyltransferase 1/2
MAGTTSTNQYLVIFTLCIACLLGSLHFYEVFPLTHGFQGKWVGVILEGQLGNQLWGMASSHGIARARNANWCWMDTTGRWATYQHYIQWLTPAPRQCENDGWANVISWVFSPYHFISDNGNFAKYQDIFISSSKPRILMKGMLQSYKFFNPDLPIPFKLRAASMARRWVGVRNITVAIHIRRGDKLWDIGNVAPPLRYYNLAISMLTRLFPQDPQTFVIVTDDPGWVQAQSEFSGMHTLMSEDPSFDMAVITACKHKIISIGTFGWWGAFLGDTGDNRTSAVIYPTLQMQWPKASGFDNSDYFPPHWTGIDYALES